MLGGLCEDAAVSLKSSGARHIKLGWILYFGLFVLYMRRVNACLRLPSNSNAAAKTCESAFQLHFPLHMCPQVLKGSLKDKKQNTTKHLSLYF